uniref:Helicase n=1 Tax=viral metagenome TaxID=1070528 RepID=A0A6C0FBP6_9ZZZZ|tara:strand:- start:11328 stop:12803 length:1476 start_codon:yes stop_codon:yes gene_type:complete
MELYNYQNDGVNWMLAHERNKKITIGDENIYINGGILADEVGLGKTMMSIDLIKRNPKRNTLILVPKSLIMQWKREFEKVDVEYNISVEVTNDYEFEFNKDVNKTHVIITSHSKLNAQHVQDFSDISYCKHIWDRVIIDEAHVIKNPKSKLHKVCCGLRADIRWALTATPVMNKMEEFVYILKWIGIPKHICQNYKNEVSESYVLRRTKNDVSLERDSLPPCNIKVHRIKFKHTEEEDLYKNAYNKMQTIIMDMNNKENRNVIQALELVLRMRQICCNPSSFLEGVAKKTKSTKKVKWNYGVTKLEKICKSIESVPKDDKVLIFCHFIKEMDMYGQVFSEKYGVCRIDGKMTLKERSMNVEMFNCNESIKIMIVQIHTGGVGYNFQRANWVYITSPTWNPAIQHQVIGRCHRNGQTKSVNVNIYAISEPDSGIYIEEYILKLQNKKRAIIADVLQDPRIKEDNYIYNVESDAKTIQFKDVYEMFKASSKQV